MSQLNVCDITLCANNAPKVPISEQTYKRAALTLGIFMSLSLFIAAFDVYIMYYVYRKKNWKYIYIVQVVEFFKHYL